MITDVLSGIDWMQFALGAGGVGAVALSGSRIMEFIDQWILKVVHPGYRGYIVLFGWAVRYRWKGETRLVALYPGLYVQIFMLLQIREFNVQDKPLPSSVGDQKILHRTTRETLGIRLNARIQYGGDGRSALLSQVHKGDPDTFVRQQIANAAIAIVNRLQTVDELRDETFYRDLMEACSGLPELCGVRVTWIGAEDLALSDQQIQKDGLESIAAAIRQNPGIATFPRLKD